MPVNFFCYGSYEDILPYLSSCNVKCVPSICCLCSFMIQCFVCRAPNPDTVLIMQTPSGVFSTKSLLQNKRRNGSRLISSNRLKLQEAPTVELNEIEPFSAARCQVFKRLNNKVPWIWDIWVIIHLHISWSLRIFFSNVNC